MPVTSTDIATIVRGHTPTVNDDAEDDEANTSSYLDHGQRKFDFAIAENAENLDQNQKDQEYSNPHRDMDIVPPVLDCDRGRGELEGQNGQPANGIVLGMIINTQALYQEDDALEPKLK
jgi:hypothetical protein